MKKLIVSALACGLAFGVSACGGKKEEGGEKPAGEKAAPAAEKKAGEEKPAAEKKAEAAANEVQLAGNDQMQFDKKKITVAAGKPVKLTLTHSGKMAKEVMGHNFVLLKQGTDAATFAGKAMAAKDSDYIPAEMKDAVIAHTKVVGGGESTTITFDAPAAGTYTFLCSFPGHFAMMKGEFIVE